MTVAAALPERVSLRARDLRAAFVGDAVHFTHWLPPETALIDTRETDDVASALREARPDVVVALGVADHDAEALAAAQAPVLGVVVPAERPPVWAMRVAPPGKDPPPAALAAAAVEERAQLWAPGSPGAACDRLVALDPADALGGRLWRTIAPPVADDLFRPIERLRQPPRFVFAGPSTEHREWWLAAAKHLHDVRHPAHGITPDRLPQLLDETDVALNAHPTPRPTFNHRVAVALAAAHLVITEPLGRRHGLEPGLDLLEVADPNALARTLSAIRKPPDTFHRVRVRGRLKAERFRASHVWARVLADFVRDVRAG